MARTRKQKKAAARNLAVYWEKVRAGQLPPPKRTRRTDPLKAFLRRGAIADPALREYLDDFSDRLLESLGGKDNASPHEVALVSLVRTHLGVVLLAEKEIGERGLEDVQGCRAATLANSHGRQLRETLKLLGLLKPSGAQSARTIDDVRRDLARRRAAA